MRFEWDDENIGHIAEHDVAPYEVEEALADPDRRPETAYRVRTEHRRAIVGATEDGRVLFVVYTPRGDRIRVVTAYDATDAQFRRYVRRAR